MKILKLLSVLCIVLMAGSSFAQQRTKTPTRAKVPPKPVVEKKFINPEGVSTPTGYSHVVTVGNTIYISGQVPVDALGNLVGKGDLRQQLVRVYNNLAICLKAAGSSFEDVVKMNTYVVNLKPEDVALVREVRKEYLSAENPPASTLVGVTALVNPDWLVEIELIAVKK